MEVIMNKTAFVFPGQGAQYVGMGRDFYENFEIAKDTFDEAGDILNFDIKKRIVNFINRLLFHKLMQLTILEDKAQKLVFEIEGLGHTFCNSLKEELRTNDSVTIAAYNITHPLKGKTKFFLETSKGEKPKDALDKAIKSLKKRNSEFIKAFKSMK